MKVLVSGKNISVGDSFQSYAEEAIDKSVAKYFERAIIADVKISKVRHLFKVDIVVNEGTGTNIVIKGSAQENEIYSSFDKAVERIAKQLRRYKRKMKNHHKTIDEEANLKQVKKFVISYDDSEEEQQEEAPVIIAEKATAIEKLTVSEAVMRMDLANLPALMFINTQNDAISVVYKRQDGNISWIDSDLDNV